MIFAVVIHRHVSSNECPNSCQKLPQTMPESGPDLTGPSRHSSQQPQDPQPQLQQQPATANAVRPPRQPLKFQLCRCRTRFPFGVPRGFALQTAPHPPLHPQRGCRQRKPSKIQQNLAKPIGFPSCSVFFLGLSMDVYKGRISEHILQIALEGPQMLPLQIFFVYTPEQQVIVEQGKTQQNISEHSQIQQHVSEHSKAQQNISPRSNT